MENGEQVPPVVQHVSDVAANVVVGAVICGEQVARPCVVAKGRKGAAHDAGCLAANENAEGFLCHAATFLNEDVETTSQTPFSPTTQTRSSPVSANASAAAACSSAEPRRLLAALA